MSGKRSPCGFLDIHDKCARLIAAHDTQHDANRAMPSGQSPPPVDVPGVPGFFEFAFSAFSARFFDAAARLPGLQEPGTGPCPVQHTRAVPCHGRDLGPGTGGGGGHAPTVGSGGEGETVLQEMIIARIVGEDGIATTRTEKEAETGAAGDLGTAEKGVLNAIGHGAVRDIATMTEITTAAVIAAVIAVGSAGAPGVATAADRETETGIHEARNTHWRVPRVLNAGQRQCPQA